MDNVKRTTELASNISRGCEHCDKLVGGDVSDGVNHFIEEHGYRLLHVGTETSHNMDGKLWHSTVAILGHDNPPALKPPVEIRIEHVIVDPKPGVR